VTQRNFLEVQRSLSGRRWTPRLQDERLAQAIAERHELPEILGRVMAARGVGRSGFAESLARWARCHRTDPY
jgi:single-stranded-DNA-specific exonuclease